MIKFRFFYIDGVDNNYAVLACHLELGYVDNLIICLIINIGNRTE